MNLSNDMQLMYDRVFYVINANEWVDSDECVISIILENPLKKGL